MYLAEDPRLGRKIALKLLSTEFTRDKDRVRRFEQEARAVSALNHPNILTIYEIGKTDSAHYIATEYIEGETLRQHVLRVRPGLQEILDIAIQIASALAAAHTAGILHRDIKPENVMLRPDGYVKILDFGLAKLTEPQEQSTANDSPTVPLFETEPGVLMGTVSYMSPEQSRGVRLDARTDIFSFGILLYEMIGGRVPFEGSSPSDIIASILERDPPPLVRYAPEAPAELERIVNKTLRKNRDERYQTVKDLLIDLRHLRQELEFNAKLQRSVRSGSSGETYARPARQTVIETSRISGIHSGPVLPPKRTSSAEYVITEIKRHKRGTAVVLSLVVLAALGMAYFGGSSSSIDSIAVLPFVSLSSDQDTEDLTNNVTERLINSLSQVPNLKVMSLSSVIRYKGQQTDPRAVGRELSVRAVLTGRVVQRGDGLSISVELVNARDNSLIWGEQYTRKLADLLLVQEEIVTEISGKLGLGLSGKEKNRLEAYQAYSRGRYYWNRRTAESLRRGIEYFEQAIQKDPSYVLAYAGLADSYNMLAVYSADPPREAFPKAKEAARKALERDERVAEAHTSLGFVAERFDWDWAGAETEYKRALDLKPGYGSGHHRYGVFLMAQGRFTEAAAELRRAQQLDPLSLIINADLSRPYYFARQYDRSIDQCRKTLEMDPNFGPAHRYLGLSYLGKKMYADAIDEYKKATMLSGDSSLMKSELAYAYAVSGNAGEARKILEELMALSTRAYVPPYYIAVIHTGLGQNDDAIEWFDKAAEERSTSCVFMKQEPILDSLRADPRFQALLAKIGL